MATRSRGCFAFEKNNRYHLFSFAEKEGVITSSVLPDFELEVGLIFEGEAVV